MNRKRLEKNSWPTWRNYNQFFFCIFLYDFQNFFYLLSVQNSQLPLLSKGFSKSSSLSAFYYPDHILLFFLNYQFSK